MKNLLNYIEDNCKDKEYEVSVEPYSSYGRLMKKTLKIKEVNQFANYLNSKNIKNEKVGILLDNCNGFVKSFYSILLNGKIIVSINNCIEQEELKDIIQKNKLEQIITNKSFTSLFEGIDIELIDIDKKIKESDELGFKVPTKKEEDDLVISYTSGTSSSFSKGVILTYKNITFVSTEYKKIYHLNEDSKIITVLPLWHNYAMFACLTSSIVAKSSLVIMKKWDSYLFIDVNKKIKPSVFPGSPYMYIDLINNHTSEISKLANLKICDSGGDSLPIECINRFEKMTGAVITEGYGLTETSSLTHFNYSAAERKIGSLGKPVSDTECKILDLEEKEVAIGEWGLLWIKGPMLFRDYVELPGQMEKVKINGWFNTNDIVKRDNDNFYYIAGRYSDLQNLSADDENLRALENDLYQFDGMSRVHVSSKYNEVAKFHYFNIYVVLKKDYSIQDLYDYINSNLKKYVIGDVVVIDKLPTTGTGKVKRNKVTKLENFDITKYDRTKIINGITCKTELLENDDKKLIYQEYYDTNLYQVDKKSYINDLCENRGGINTIPRILLKGKNEEKSWLITEYKAGETLNSIRKNDKDFDFASIVADFAKTLCFIHSIKGNKYGWITGSGVIEKDNLSDYLSSEIVRFKDSINGLVNPKDMKYMEELANKVIDKIKIKETFYNPCLCWFDINDTNILVNDNKLSAIIDAGGARFGIKEWDLAFIKYEVCQNDYEFNLLFNEYKKIDGSIDKELIDDLGVFIELDDMEIRVSRKINIPIPYCSKLRDIIDRMSK